MTYGFVYVVGNESMPGVYKVGFTERSPSLRCEELTKGTAVPSSFQLVCYAEYSDARARELAIHQLLADVRVASDREFFRCDLLKITDLVMDEERSLSLCHHEMKPWLYSTSALFRRRLAAGAAQQDAEARIPEPVWIQG